MRQPPPPSPTGSHPSLQRASPTPSPVPAAPAAASHGPRRHRIRDNGRPLRRLDRQGACRRGSRRHARRGGAAPRARRTGGHPAAGVPGRRRCGAGVALVGAGWWLHRRPGGRVGAIALAATGIAAAYIDVIAVTTVYHWVPARGRAGARRRRRGRRADVGTALGLRASGLLVLVPLLGLGPAVVGGVTVLLVGFMLALSAASLPVQLGKDWIGMHGARIAVVTLPLLVALVAVNHDSRRGGLAGRSVRSRRGAGPRERADPAAEEQSSRRAWRCSRRRERFPCCSSRSQSTG